MTSLCIICLLISKDQLVLIKMPFFISGSGERGRGYSDENCFKREEAGGEM